MDLPWLAGFAEWWPFIEQLSLASHVSFPLSGAVRVV